MQTTTDTLQRLTVASGIEAVAQGDILRVTDARGRLMLEARSDGSIVLHVTEGDLELSATHGALRLHGERGVHVSGSQVVVETPHLREVVGVLETHAKRIVEKTIDSYREAQGVSQVRAAQVRMIATKTFRALAERVRMRASKDTKIDGEKVYLG